VRIGEGLGHLLKVKQHVIQTQSSQPAQRPQIAAGHVFKHQIMGLKKT